ncbi:MAG: hypothetical protein WD136_08790, partial [Cyanobium sp.]
QPSRPMGAPAQIAILLAVTTGLLDHLPLDALEATEARISEAVGRDLPDLCSRIQAGQPLGDDDREDLLSLIRAHTHLHGRP